MEQLSRPRPTALEIVVDTAVVLAANALALSTLWPVYQSAAFIVTLTAASLLGGAIAILGARFRWSALLMLAVIVGVYLLVGVPLGVPGRALFGVIPTPAGFMDLLTGTALSWKQLITIVTPVGSYQALLVPVLVLALLSAVVGLSIALRARRPEAAVAVPLVLFVAAILFGPETAMLPVITAVVLGILLVMWVMWLQRRRRTAALAAAQQRSARPRSSAAVRRITTMRTVLTATVIVAVAVAVGSAAAVAMPSNAARDVLRTHAQQPFDPRDYPSPLSVFRSYLRPENADRTMFTVAGLPIDGRVRLAALDTYDGVVYSVGSDQVASSSGSFTRLPYRIDQSAVTGDPATIVVTVDSYRSVWVPGVGKLESIRFTSDDSVSLGDAFYYNDVVATGAVLGGLRRGDSYRSEAVVPRSAAEIGELKPGTAVLPPVGVEPDGMEAALDAWADPQETPGERLAAMIAGLQRDGYVSHGLSADEPPSRSGHAADRIAQLFSDKPMVGDAEQYAVAAALMARMIGFPARVVVGFVPTVSASGPVAITGSDISAWIEVQDSSGAWLTIDPNPEVRPIPDEEPDEPTTVSRPQVVVPPPPEDPRQPDDVTQPQSAPDDDNNAPDPVLELVLAIARIAGWVLLGLAVVASPFLAVIAAKLRRRRLRRAAPTALARVEGGWREFSDLAVDRGYDLPASATRAEAAAVVGGMRPLVLASSVDRAVFAPGEPSTVDGDRVWEQVTELKQSLDAPLTRFERLRAAVSLRSLRRGGRR